MTPTDPTTAATDAEPGNHGFLQIAMIIVVVGSLAALLLIGALAPQQYRRLTAFGLASIAAALTLLELRRGNTAGAYRMLTYGAWCGMTVSAAINGGMTSPAILLYPVLILVAGWVMGTRTVLILTGASLAAEFLFVVGTNGHWLPEQAPPPPGWIFFAHALILAVSASLALFVRRSFAARFAEIAHRDADLSAQYGLYRALLDAQSSAGVGMFIIENGRIVYSNDAFRQLVGYSDEELRALPSFITLTHPDDRERVMNNHRRRLAGEQFESRYDIGVLRNDGERRDVEITVTNLAREGGAGLLVLTVDITERKLAEQAMRRSEERFAQVFQVSPVAASIARATDGTFIAVNDVYRQYFGWTREDMVGRTSVEIGLWPTEAVRKPWADELQRRGMLRDYETVWLHKSGEPRNVRISAVTIEFDGESCILALVHDITELRQSELHFSRVFSASPIATAISRLDDGHILEANDAFLRLFDWPRHEVIGRSTVELGVWPDAAARATWLDALRTEGTLLDYEARLDNRAGAARTVHLSAEVIDFADQRCVLAFIYDLTARRHAETMLREIVEGTSRATGAEFFRALVHHLARALDVPLALVGEVRAGDESTLHTLAFWATDGYAPEIDYELATTPCGQVFGQQPRLFASNLSALFPRSACMMQKVGADSYYGYPLTGAAGEPLGVLAIMDSRPLDASEERTALMSIFAARAAAELERQRAEAEIHRINADLEERVRRRTNDLTEANSELESFAYSISHDLRAPLRGIDGFSRLLQEEYGERLDQQGNEYLMRVRRAAQRLGTLIDDLLELSRVARHEMRRVKVDLSTLVADIVEDLRKAEPERSIAVAIKHRCATQGDPQLLRVLLENLLGNAWKYSRHIADARIEFGSEASGQETVYFVRDNGIGFDMTYAGKLFAPFQRLHNSADFEGSGIGLASAARIVRRHGGNIWAESTPGQGAMFRFTLGGG